MQNQYSFNLILFLKQSIPMPVIRQRNYKNKNKEKIILGDDKNAINISIDIGYWPHKFFLTKTMKQSCLTARTASLDRLFQRLVLE